MRNSFILSGIFLLLNVSLMGQSELKPDPGQKFQQWKGWGISLAWWANCMGGWDEATVNEISNWITSPDELDMNVFRFNIGGGDNPGHTHKRKDGGNVPSYKPAENADFDWSADANQRNFLLKINSLRKDAIYEAASYSPPWWMTKSGCSSGDTSGKDNLKEEYYDDFANYLTTTVLHYKTKYGITFSTLSPVNEPFSVWWKALGDQEGCAFSQESQHHIIREVYKSLEKNNMLGYCKISVMDANSVEECLKGLQGYEKAGDIVPLISQVNTHSYVPAGRIELKKMSDKLGLSLWQSESGPLDVTLKGLDNYLLMAQRIVTDIRELQPEVWCDWQLASGGTGDGRWGLVSYDAKNKTYQREKSYYVRKQFSKYIKPGYTFIAGSDKNSLAALSPDGKQLVMVIVNEDAAEKKISIDLSGFRKTAKSALVYRTSQTEDCRGITEGLPVVNKKSIYMAPAKSVTTIQLEVNIK
ncbi:MAG: glycoside hydrolase [Bacteroidales bacterium]|nr:glycoside hydrolase [Bacteroidales bacterium]